jgi:hypothetical protein
MKVKKKCKFCGKEFEIENYENKIRLYCSKQCSANDKKKIKPVKICKFCGKKFTTLSYESKRLYCSRQCSANDHSGKHFKGGNKLLISKICEFCKKEYKVWSYRDKSKYCSKACKHNAGNIIAKCKECGVKIKKPRWLYNSGLTEQYCDKCKKKYSPKCSIFELDVYNEVKKKYNAKQNVLLRFEKRKIYPDILINDNFIIECMGDYFHCNPKRFNENYLNLKINKLAKDIWQADENRKEVLEKNSYKVYYIWESEWIKDKNNVLKQIENAISKN